MPKWSIPNNKDKKRIAELEEVLAAYLDTDETPDDDTTEFGDIKRAAKALLQKGNHR